MCHPITWLPLHTGPSNIALFLLCANIATGQVPKRLQNRSKHELAVEFFLYFFKRQAGQHKFIKIEVGICNILQTRSDTNGAHENQYVTVSQRDRSNSVIVVVFTLF